jgi:hypothetical protein
MRNASGANSGTNDRDGIVIRLPGVARFKLRPPASAHRAQRRAERRSRWHGYETYEQRKLAELLRRLIVPGTCFWSAVENKPRSIISGMYQKLSGVRSGFPDLVFLRAEQPPIFIEMKSPAGQLNKEQRAIRAELLAQGCKWFLCRSALSALVALHGVGIEFRPIRGRAWQPPVLLPWEEPVEDPSVPHKLHPLVTARRRESKRRQRAARRLREAQAELTAADTIAAAE